MMKTLIRRVRMFAVLQGGLCGVLLLTAPALQAQDDGSAAFDGQWRYETSCADCHGDNGEGVYPFGTALRGNTLIQNAPPQTIINVIQNGRLNRDKTNPAYSGMPAFKTIRAGEARALVSYLKGGLQEE